MSNLLGIEAGGTKFFVSIGDKDGSVLERTRVDTTTPEETMPQVLKVMEEYQEKHSFSAIGVGCFGPLDPDPKSPTYGYITSTPKLPWQDYPIIGTIKEKFSQPIAFDTDVNAALLCEWYWGHGKGLSDIVYVTVGTGIGAGVLANGQVVHGTHHTEIGHLRIPRSSLEKDSFAGYCPFHGDCLEGLASGPAIKDRWRVSSALDLGADHEGWVLEVEYLSYMVHNLMCALVPEKIVLGGGVMKQAHLFGEIHKQAAKSINGYIRHCTEEGLAKIVVPASFGDNTGAKGALALALSAEK